MKTLSVAVAVAVVLTVICLQESSAVPSTEVQDLDEPMSNDGAVAAYKEMPEESWKMGYGRRRWKCRFCCRCCPRMRGCGLCCRF